MADLTKKDEPEMVQMDMQVLRQTDKAVLVTLDTNENAVWLPLSQIYMLETGVEDIESISMPEWLAIEKGLV